MRINNNISALNAWRGLTNTDNALSKSLEKLSSGLRINRAGDDAAGLAISEKMRGQIRGLNQAVRNAQDGISLIQTAEGALTESHAILQRMRELAVQSSNDTNTEEDRAELQKELNQLIDELNRISTDTEFNTQTLLDGSFFGKKFQIGANENQNMIIDIAGMSAADMGIDGVMKAVVATNSLDFSTNNSTLTIGNTSFRLDKDYTGSIQSLAADLSAAFMNEGISVSGDGVNLTFQGAAAFKVTATGSGAGIAAGDTDATGATTGATLDTLRVDVNAGAGGILTHDDAKAAITAIDNAIKTVSGERSKLGAMQNRLEHTIKNLGVAAENLAAAESRIRDVDMAAEMMNFTKQNILMQAGTAMLAQANARPQSVLQLLG